MNGFKKTLYALTIISCALSATPPAGSEWTMRWNDEFNGSSLDRSVWDDEYVWGRTHNYDGYCAPENVIVEDGKLRLKAEKESRGGATFTTAAVISKPGFNFKYGYLEGRFKVPSGYKDVYNGLWPAFWMAPTDVSWPPEIDIFEFFGRNKEFAGHVWWRSGGAVNEGDKIQRDDLVDNWHTYAMYWDSDKVELYFNDEKYFTSFHPPQKEMYVLINFGICSPASSGDLDCSDFGDARQNSFPKYLECDWVRYYEKGASTPTQPRILSQPRDLRLSEGKSATFTVSATGSQPLAYQWKRNGRNISGATGESYTLESVVKADDDGVTFSVTVSNDHGSASSEEAMLTVVDFDGVKAYRTGAAPAIDGVIDGSWTLGDKTAIRKAIVGSAGADDVSGTFLAHWDADKLYVLVEVSDDQLQSEGDAPHNDDCVEIYFDIGNDGASSYGEDDYQYKLVYNTAQVTEEKSSAISGVVGATRQSDNGYVAEVAFPWSTLGQSSPDDGVLFGFDVFINDDDDGGERDAQVGWYGTSANWQDPSNFGTAKLVTEGAVAQRQVRIRPYADLRMVREGSRIHVAAAPDAALFVTVTDPRGRKILAQSGRGALSVSTKSYAPGLYVIHARTGAEEAQRSLFVTP